MVRAKIELGGGRGGQQQLEPVVAQRPFVSGAQQARAQGKHASPVVVSQVCRLASSHGREQERTGHGAEFSRVNNQARGSSELQQPFPALAARSTAYLRRCTRRRLLAQRPSDRLYARLFSGPRPFRQWEDRAQGVDVALGLGRLLGAEVERLRRERDEVRAELGRSEESAGRAGQ